MCCKYLRHWKWYYFEYCFVSLVLRVSAQSCRFQKRLQPKVLIWLGSYYHNYFYIFIRSIIRTYYMPSFFVITRRIYWRARSCTLQNAFLDKESVKIRHKWSFIATPLEEWVHTLLYFDEPLGGSLELKSELSSSFKELRELVQVLSKVLNERSMS